MIDFRGREYLHAKSQMKKNKFAPNILFPSICHSLMYIPTNKLKINRVGVNFGCHFKCADIIFSGCSILCCILFLFYIFCSSVVISFSGASSFISTIIRQKTTCETCFCFLVLKTMIILFKNKEKKINEILKRNEI